MDKLEFKIQNKQIGDFKFKTVSIFVNGQDLIERLKNYEMPFAKKEGSEIIAGGYDGLTPETIYKYLTNPEDMDKDENGKISLLGCAACGLEDCWPMKIKTIEAVDKIIWTEFEQPFRSVDSNNFWDYTNFGQLSFDKKNYNEQLDKLRKTINSVTK
jgi:hypothetical protein